METANDSVRFVRLVTGEDIISEIMEVEDTSGKHVILYNPLKIMYMASPMNSDKVGISLLEWVFSRISEKQEFRIESKDVLMIAPPSDSLNTYYWDTIDYFAKKKASYSKSRPSDDELEERWEKALRDAFSKDDGENIDETYFDDLDETPIEETEGYKMLQEFLNKRKGTLH